MAKDKEPKVGRPKKRETSHLFSLRLPPEFHGALKLYAATRSDSLNDVLIEMIEAQWRRVPDHEQYMAMAARAVKAAKKPKSGAGRG